MPAQSRHSLQPTCSGSIGSITIMASRGGAGRETGNYGPFNAQLPVGRAVADLAAAQHLVVELAQLVELGWSASAVRKRASTGLLHRCYRGVYSLVPPRLLKREGRWMAAVLACGPGAVLSHRSAGALHAVRPYNGTKIDVTIPGRVHRGQPGIVIHRSTTLAEADTTDLDGIACTTVARTLFDLADVTRRRGLERAFDQSEILEAFDLTAMQDQLERNRGRRRASGLVKVVLNEHYIGSTPTLSWFEERLLPITRSLGIPDPEVNQWLILPDGGAAIKPDFMWRQQRLIIETDGAKTHGTRQAFESDRRRDQRLVLAGWRVIRITWRQLKRRPHEIRALLKGLWNR
jgi:very-short-patch-repair endonuclease